MVLLSYLVEIPRYWESYIDTYSYDDHLYYVHVASALWMSYLYQLLYKTIFMVTVRIMVPLLITLVLTVKLTVTVRRARKIRSGLVAANNSGDQNVIKHYKSVKSNEDGDVGVDHHRRHVHRVPNPWDDLPAVPADSPDEHVR